MFSPSLGPCACPVITTFLSMWSPTVFCYWSWRAALGKVRLVPDKQKSGKEVFHHLERTEWENWVSSRTQSRGQYLPRRLQSRYHADCWLQITASCSDIYKQQHSLLRCTKYTRICFPFTDLSDWWKFYLPWWISVSATENLHQAKCWHTSSEAEVYT